jgi:hypothetical protein
MNRWSDLIKNIWTCSGYNAVEIDAYQKLRYGQNSSSGKENATRPTGIGVEVAARATLGCSGCIARVGGGRGSATRVVPRSTWRSFAHRRTRSSSGDRRRLWCFMEPAGVRGEEEWPEHGVNNDRSVLFNTCQLNFPPPFFLCIVHEQINILPRY